MNINVTEEWIYEDHMVTRWDAELNVEEIIATIDATVAVAKRKPEKNSGADHSLGINRLNDQRPVVLLAPLVEYWTGIAEVKGSNPEQAWIFSGVVFPTAKVVHIIDECYKHGIWRQCGKSKTLVFQFLPASWSSPFPHFSSAGSWYPLPQKCFHLLLSEKIN